MKKLKINKNKNKFRKAKSYYRQEICENYYVTDDKTGDKRGEF